MVLQQVLQMTLYINVQCPQPFQNTQAIWVKWVHVKWAERVVYGLFVGTVHFKCI